MGESALLEKKAKFRSFDCAVPASIRIDEHFANIEEIYQDSLRSLRLVGKAAIAGYHENFNHPFMAEGYTDFVSAVGENLVTDREYGERLQFDPFQRYEVIDGFAVDKSGRRLKDMVVSGWAASVSAAQKDPKMAIQAERDYGDVLVMEHVESLKPGQFAAFVSMDPKTAIKDDREFWEDHMNYREGMAVIQTYYRSTENKLYAGNYSIKESDLSAMRDVMRLHGSIIPEDESENRYIRYAMTSDEMSLLDARSFGPKFVESYRQRIGKTHEMISVTDLIKDNEQVLKDYFNTYVVPLMRAKVSGKGVEPCVRDLAVAILSSSKNCSSKQRNILQKIARYEPPNDEDVRFFIGKIRYAAVEELRKYIVSKNNSRKQPTIRHKGFNGASVQHQQFLQQQIAGNIERGTNANRNYGGCSNASGMEQNQEELGKQGVFSGNGNLPDDKHGSRYFKCPQRNCGRMNERRIKNQLLTHCQHCNAEIPKC